MTPGLRDMTEEDVSRLILLERRLFPHPWNEKDFEGELLFTESCCRVLEKDGEILAYICYRGVPDGFELLKIATHPDFQKKGFAGRLLKELFFLARNAVCSDIFLEVAVTNEKAAAFYKKYGFTVCGRRKAYYPGGIDALNMVRRELSN